MKKKGDIYEYLMTLSVKNNGNEFNSYWIFELWNVLVCLFLGFFKSEFMIATIECQDW